MRQPRDDHKARRYLSYSDPVLYRRDVFLGGDGMPLGRRILGDGTITRPTPDDRAASILMALDKREHKKAAEANEMAAAYAAAARAAAHAATAADRAAEAIQHARARTAKTADMRPADLLTEAAANAAAAAHKAARAAELSLASLLRTSPPASDNAAAGPLFGGLPLASTPHKRRRKCARCGCAESSHGGKSSKGTPFACRTCAKRSALQGDHPPCDGFVREAPP